ncbi:MAG: restriction endonuclease subunit R [Spirochaetes bacterium]|nr:MAG: restriction endonuclease subunit R [Spirochaetota bacterium]
MNHLHQHLELLVAEWRDDGYPTRKYSAIAEILEWSHESANNTLRFLRRPQLRALETYWYLRLVEETPHILDLYRKLIPKQSQLLEALGLNTKGINDLVLDEGIDSLWERIKKDDGFVRDFKLESLRETITLDYPSYILALAMGAGKTILMGAIIATEFAMALEYPNGPFVRNALVFAPGKTILESLRELVEIPFDRILPPRMYKSFAASVKFTFTRDGEKDIPVIRRSSFNVVVTNTEKIRIQKESIRKADLGPLLIKPEAEDEARTEVANLRLQAIASLPHLAVFSDEAHHTYGQSLDSELKKVRKTVDYLNDATNVYCVVNTTGTPYFKKQALKDVVFWYGLSQGIKEGYLKDLAGSIQAYDFDGNAAVYVEHVIKDFFSEYGDVKLPDGSPSKIALYFPQTDDLRELRPHVDKALMESGRSPALCLVNTSDESLTKSADIDAFNRLNDPASPHRVMLLVNKGTEGWNCPSLFACALARRLRSSNNFVLQAATRCLRQVPGNERKARVYLSTDNFSVLDHQLQETFGESITDLNRAGQESRRERIVIRKLDLPPLVVTRMVRTVVKKEGASGSGRIKLARPKDGAGATMEKKTFTLKEQLSSSGVLQQMGDAVVIEHLPEAADAYMTAQMLAAQYRLDFWIVYDELKRLYGNDDIPLAHCEMLGKQVEEQTRFYDIHEEKVDVALALIKPEGFEKEIDAGGAEIYTAEIVYPKDREALIARYATWKSRAGEFGFHYDPYNFDSKPEQHFFEQMLHSINLKPGDIEDIYFTGALTDPGKTDFFVEYKDEKGKWRRYTPDFIIRKKPPRGGKPGTGRVFIIEIKSERERNHPTDGENGRKAMAVKKWQDLDPKRLRYEMIFTATDTVTADQAKPAREFIEETE